MSAATTFHSFSIEKTSQFEISNTEAALRATSGNYAIMLINMTDILIDRGCYNYRPGQNNTFFQISPPVGRTCSADYETCHSQQRWLPVWNCQCGDAPFNLTLVSAEGRGATWNITPNCDAAGGSIGLS